MGQLHSVNLACLSSVFIWLVSSFHWFLTLTLCPGDNCPDTSVCVCVIVWGHYGNVHPPAALWFWLEAKISDLLFCVVICGFRYSYLQYPTSVCGESCLSHQIRLNCCVTLNFHHHHVMSHHRFKQEMHQWKILMHVYVCFLPFKTIADMRSVLFTVKLLHCPLLSSPHTPWTFFHYCGGKMGPFCNTKPAGLPHQSQCFWPFVPSSFWCGECYRLKNLKLPYLIFPIKHHLHNWSLFCRTAPQFVGIS